MSLYKPINNLDQQM